ncbi:MAG: hypothetical protein H0U57_12055 [Tatlockia sp.]|nr:hypothetical protein [Tatlockia sp.]
MPLTIIRDPLINTHYKILEACKTIDEKVKVFDTMSDNTKNALQALRYFLKSQLKEASKPGLVFDTNIWLIATEIYAEDAKNNRNPDKTIFKLNNRMSYLIHVKEFIAGFLGTAYLNLHAQGMCYNTFEDKTLKSGCIIRHDECSYFDTFFSGSNYSTPPHYVSIAGSLSTHPDGSYHLLSSCESHSSSENEYGIEKRRARAMKLGKNQKQNEELDNRLSGPGFI